MSHAVILTPAARRDLLRLADFLVLRYAVERDRVIVTRIFHSREDG